MPVNIPGMHVIVLLTAMDDIIFSSKAFLALGARSRGRQLREKVFSIVYCLTRSVEARRGGLQA